MGSRLGMGWWWFRWWGPRPGKSWPGEGEEPAGGRELLVVKLMTRQLLSSAWLDGWPFSWLGS